MVARTALHIKNTSHFSFCVCVRSPRTLPQRGHSDPPGACSRMRGHLLGDDACALRRGILLFHVFACSFSPSPSLPPPPRVLRPPLPPPNPALRPSVPFRGGPPRCRSATPSASSLRYWQPSRGARAGLFGGGGLRDGVEAGRIVGGRTWERRVVSGGAMRKSLLWPLRLTPVMNPTHGARETAVGALGPRGAKRSVMGGGGGWHGPSGRKLEVLDELADVGRGSSRSGL